MKLAIYLLCIITSALCAWLLLRAHSRTRTRLLLWSGLCFCFMAMQNVALLVDLYVLPTEDLRAFRVVPALISVALLLFGLIWETKR